MIAQKAATTTMPVIGDLSISGVLRTGDRI